MPLVVHGFWGRGLLSLICKDFLHLCGWLELHWFLKANSVYNSITETKEVQRLIMKVRSINVCLFSCQFYYTYELILMKLLSIVRFSKEKIYDKYIDFTVEAYNEYFEMPFFRWGSFFLIQLWIFIVVQQREEQTKIGWLQIQCEGRSG